MSRGDEHTEEEIRQAVWWCMLGLSAEQIARNLGRHSKASVHMMLVSTAGSRTMHASALMIEVGEQLDREPRFAGWRDEVSATNGGLV